MTGKREPDQIRLAIVVPCFNEEQVVNASAERLLGVLRELAAAREIDAASFLFFVDDGSTDRTWALISELHRTNPQVKGLKLARNVGHQNALLAGLLSVRELAADCAVSIDADLQHDERAIPAFLARYREGADIVYGVRQSRATDSFLKRSTALSFYYLMRLMGVNVIKNHADYRLLSGKALRAVADYKEVNLFLRGIFPEMGFNSAVVLFDTRERFAGRSKYSLRRMISFALDGITSFSVTPLRFVTLAGVLIFIFSCAMSAWIVWSAVRGRVVPGWASTLIPIYLLGGVQIMVMGLLGEYLGKLYKEVKARPRFIKDSELL